MRAPLHACAASIAIDVEPPRRDWSIQYPRSVRAHSLNANIGTAHFTRNSCARDGEQSMNGASGHRALSTQHSLEAVGAREAARDFRRRRCNARFRVAPRVWFGITAAMRFSIRSGEHRA